MCRSGATVPGMARNRPPYNLAPQTAGNGNRHYPPPYRAPAKYPITGDATGRTPATDFFVGSIEEGAPVSQKIGVSPGSRTPSTENSREASGSLSGSKQILSSLSYPRNTLINRSLSSSRTNGIQFRISLLAFSPAQVRFALAVLTASSWNGNSDQTWHKRFGSSQKRYEFGSFPQWPPDCPHIPHR